MEKHLTANAATTLVHDILMHGLCAESSYFDQIVENIGELIDHRVEITLMNGQRFVLAVAEEPYPPEMLKPQA